ncbi:MAG TPA: hypothetical protein VM368_03280, partial [Flavisolibacter sp.]|nr:hypothetical protein [Flavisolibacter sp.]
MATKSRIKKKRSFGSKLWRRVKKTFIILFVLQFFYIIILKWFYPPITITQISSLISGYGLKRDYVSNTQISEHMKLAVIAAEDQIFP